MCLFGGYLTRGKKNCTDDVFLEGSQVHVDNTFMTKDRIFLF